MLPAEVLENVLGFLSRDELPTVQLASKQFCSFVIRRFPYFPLRTIGRLLLQDFTVSAERTGYDTVAVNYSDVAQILLNASTELLYIEGNVTDPHLEQLKPFKDAWLNSKCFLSWGTTFQDNDVRSRALLEVFVVNVSQHHQATNVLFVSERTFCNLLTSGTGVPRGIYTRMAIPLQHTAHEYHLYTK